MLAVVSRYKLLLAILLIILTAALVWFYIALQDGDKDFSKGVFVMIPCEIGHCKDGIPSAGCSAGLEHKQGLYWDNFAGKGVTVYESGYDERGI